MKTTVNKKEHNVVEVTAVYDKDEWKKAQEDALTKLSGQVRMDGFRPGKAPKALVKKRIGAGNIMSEAVDALVEKSYAPILLDNNIMPVSQPQVSVEKMTEDELEIRVTCEVAPEVELKKYKDLGVEKGSTEVTDEDVQKRLEDYQNEFAELMIKEDGAEAENGDTANIDYEGFLDGEPFAGGKGENYPLELGSGTFIPGFEDQVIGMKVGDEKDIDVTFPEEYQAPDLAGKAVVFKVKVNELKKKVLPEIDDDLAMDVNIDGVETLDQLKDRVRDDLKVMKERTADEEYEEAIVDALIEANPMELPQSMVENEAQNMISGISQNLQAQGITLQQYQQMMGTTTEQMKEELMEQAEKRVKYQLIVNKVVEAENIEVSEDDVEEEYKNLAEMYGREVDDIKKILGSQEGALRSDLAFRKAVELIKENA